MKYLLSLCFLIATTTLLAQGNQLDGTWKVRAGDHNYGTMTIRGSNGDYLMHVAGADQLKITKWEDTGRGYANVTLERSGAYQQIYEGVVTPERKFIAGTFYNKKDPSVKYPWYAEFLIRMKQ